LKYGVWTIAWHPKNASAECGFKRLPDSQDFGFF
jgi:hypothetical protein